MRVLVATTSETPAALLVPLAAALEAEGIEVWRAELGKVREPGAGGLFDRVMGALVGEVETRRLTRELTAQAPDVALALDAAAAAALVRERDGGGVRPVPVVAVVGELAPRRSWACDADRYAAIDDEAAVALADHGVDGARVSVVGAPVRAAWSEAGKKSRAELRARFKLPAEGPVVLVEAGGWSPEALGQLLVQLALVDGTPVYLFEVLEGPDGGAAGAAALVRKQVPGLGLKGKLFGKTEDAPLLWRAADVVVARPRPRAVLGALAVGAAFVALAPEGPREVAEARALEERGIGVVSSMLMVSSALSALAKDARLRAGAAQAAARRGRPEGGAGRGGDAAAAVAVLVREVAERREAVLAETREAAQAAAAAAAGSAAAARAASAAAGTAAAAAAARVSAPPSDLEDLGGGDLDDLPAAPPPPRPAASASGAPSGGAPPPRPRPAVSSSIDDEIAAMKRAEARRATSVDDELLALKRKMQSEGKKK